MTPTIRGLVVASDMLSILGIENQSFKNPWSADDFIRSLKHRNCVGTVAECAGFVVGFAINELHNTRLQLLSLAVHVDFRRRGMGRALLRGVSEKFLTRRRRRILLEVRETNLPAQLFFRSCGFHAVSVEKGFYSDSPEDAYVFELRRDQQGLKVDSGKDETQGR